jgi:hypothetical protein
MCPSLWLVDKYFEFPFSSSRNPSHWTACHRRRNLFNESIIQLANVQARAQELEE